jgi:hypothetical protein
MGASLSKVRCLYLPAQSGKTRKSEDLITAVRGVTPRSIDIWISANNKLLVYQTTSRLKKDLGLSTEFSDAVIKGKLFSWTSGTNATNIPYESLRDRLLSGEIEAILVCSHRARLTYLALLLESLTRSGFDKDVHIWIDEADRSCKLWSTLADVATLPLVKSITLVSATFTEVFKRYDELAVIPYLDTSPKPYRRLKDCLLTVVDSPLSGSDYVAAILDAHPELCEPGLKAFIPGSVFRASHEAISECLLSRGFAVVLLNGSHKEIRLPDGSLIPLKPHLTVKGPDAIPDEFNITLARLYGEHDLDRFPLAITGFLCVERGVTFQSADFLFDYAILGNVAKRCEAYQSVARVFGNVGHFAGYKPCQIFTTSQMIKDIREQEETACHLARIVHEEGLAVVDASVLKRAATYTEDKRWSLETHQFATFGLARAFLKSHGLRSPPGPVLDPDGFYRCAFRGRSRAVLSLAETLESMASWSKTAPFDIEEERPFYAKFLICYKNIKDPDSVVFVVRALTKKIRVLVRKRIA